MVENNNGCTKRFEELPVVGFLQLDEGRIQEVSDYARKINGFYDASREAAASYRHYSVGFLNLLERYHVASDYLARLTNNSTYIRALDTTIVLNSDIEKSLFAMLVCDGECKYYDLYEAKRKEGLSHGEAMDYLQLFFGVKSSKLIQLERYYKLLRYRLARNKEVVFDSPDDVPPKR